MSMHSLAVTGGSMNVLVAKPRTPRGGAVVLIQEIFGVNATMRAAADLVASLGYVAIVPDLFWRLEEGVDLEASDPAQFERGIALMQKFDQAQGVQDLKATLTYARTLAGNHRAGTWGYCLGGRLAVLMALESDADVNVSYYGVGLEGLAPRFPTITAPLVVHIAAEDKFVPPPAQDTIRSHAAGHARIGVHLYQGADHGFARPNGAHFDALQATIANGRSAAALEAAFTA